MQRITVCHRDSVVPAAAEVEGNKSALLLTDAGASKAISIVYYESEAHATAAQANATRQEEIATFGSFFAGPHSVEGYEGAVRAWGGYMR